MDAGKVSGIGAAEVSEQSWWRSLTRYQWLVFTVASLGWLFDCMDQQLFNLARVPALTELLVFPDGTGADAVNAAVTKHGGNATSVFLIGWAVGGVVFGILGDRLGRARTMMLMGFCQLALFGGDAIYFPELFPTRLRNTGTSFCYNVGRLVAAAGPVSLGLLTSRVFVDYAEPLRHAGVAMCAVFLVGLLALPFAPETKGLPLPE
jgi:MFS family permease